MIAAFYKSTRPGLAGIYNRGVRVMTKSHYSHCEAIFSDGWSASASFMDHGVRFKKIDYDPAKWDFIRLHDWMEASARKWFEEHKGEGYDILGNVHFAIPLVGDDKSKWCCSEALGAAFGVHEAWRFHPGALAAVFNSIVLDSK